MPNTNLYPFCADYSDVARCLFAIQADQQAGLYDNDQELLEMLTLLQQDLLKKLYNRTLSVLARVNGGITELRGDFEDYDFTYMDFHVGYLDGRNDGYSSTFQTILNILRDFCGGLGTLTAAESDAITGALSPVLELFEQIKAHLAAIGQNPCTAFESKYINNKPGVILQAAGSDGSTGIPKGLHLRWAFTDELGNNHLAKGNYFQSPQNVGFNKTDDFVRIYRTPYTGAVSISLQFLTDKPVIEFSSKSWTFFKQLTLNGEDLSSRVKLTFEDANAYHQLAATVDPRTLPADFINQYTGVIRIQAVGKAIFKASFELDASGTGQPQKLKIEALSTETGNTAQTDAQQVHSWKTVPVTAGTVVTSTIMAENMTTLRIKKTAGVKLKALHLESYHDFISSRNNNDWTQVGNGFALSVDDQQVYNRLETSAYVVNHLWPQYNNGTTVRVSNYQQKWSSSSILEPSVKSMVSTYLQLSQTDPRATAILDQESILPGQPGISVSYLDVVNLHATDYHFARMLGLGCIDVIPGVTPAERYVYQLRYTNRQSMQSSVQTDYIYTTLPTSIVDFRLPQTPVMNEIKYGLPQQDAEGGAFDASGYTALDNVRAVNISRAALPDEQYPESFFQDDAYVLNFNIFEQPKAVFYGVEYRAQGQGQYVKPEITQENGFGTTYYAYDTDFPTQGVPETVPVPDNATSLYLHFERSIGIHHYAIYGINWFSRASAISAEKSTDATAFPLSNLLSAPADLSVQYIQREDTLLFTTTREQGWHTGRAAAFPGQDIFLTRITFNWLDIIDVSRYPILSQATLQSVPRANKAKLHFRPAMPMEVKGLIINILPVEGDETRSRLYTGSYVQLDGTLNSPAISSTDYGKFVNSRLITPEGEFRVVQIEQGTTWPVITVSRNVKTETVEDELEPGFFGVSKIYADPDLNARFSLVENLAEESAWSPLEETVSLVSFADPADPLIESHTDPEGNVSRYWIGGISGLATITPMFSFPAGSEDMPGYYTVTFEAGITLPAHPQVNLPYDPAFPMRNPPGSLHSPHVEWYQGLLRAPRALSAGQMKQVQVQAIDQQAVLKIYVYDPDYQTDPIEVSQAPGTTITVDFHPGYRAYLFAEPASQHAFNSTNILPVNSALDKRSLLGIQSADLRPGGSGFSSSVSLPAVLLARNVEEPVKMEEPVIPGLKVRPDATGKASFTFDMRVLPTPQGQARSPFGFMFYRSSSEDLLDAFYAVSTKIQIISSLEELIEDPYFTNRYYELINLIFDPANPGHFKVFQAEPEPYGFPVPDKPGLTLPGDNLNTKIQKYKAAISSTLLPLAEQLPVYGLIRSGLQTENQLPAIRDIDGNLLSSTDPRFNPFPMVRKYTDQGKNYVRFTDYTLNGSSRNLYFYAGAEMNNQLVGGEMSTFAGPVTILQTNAAEPPVIRSFATALPAVPDARPEVIFRIAPFAEAENIDHVRIYRTINAAKTNFVEEMELISQVPLAEGELEVSDTFEDAGFDPAGRKLYYRLVGVRTILNETGQQEEILSVPSLPVELQVVDTRNPQAPGLVYSALQNKLSWSPTTFKGTYYLFRQNQRGNWERIYTIAPPASDQPMFYQIPSQLPPLDAQGNKIYYRFKVQVQNASGLMNILDNELTIG